MVLDSYSPLRLYGVMLSKDSDAIFFLYKLGIYLKWDRKCCSNSCPLRKANI
jgi:hypothetical protein